MSKMSVMSVNLYDLQKYAITYFEEDFAKLPSARSLRFEGYQPKEAEQVHSLSIASARLHVGYRAAKPSGSIYAYADTKSNKIYYTIHKQRKLRLFDDMSFTPADLFEPFQYLLRGNRAGETLQLEQFLTYLFMEKGHISYFKDSHVLTTFELICKSVTRKRSIVGSGNKDAQEFQAMKKFYDCIQTLDTNLFAAGNSKEKGKTASTNPTSLKRPSLAIVDKDLDAKVIDQRKAMHTDSMKKMAQERGAEAYQTIEELSALKTKIVALEANITQKNVQRKNLQAQVTQDAALKLQLESNLESAVNDLSQVKKLLKDQIEFNRTLRIQLQDAQTREALGKEKANVAKNAKLDKAKTLYVMGREMMSLVCGKGDNAKERRQDALDAFEKDFGELASGGKSIGG